MEAAAVHPCVRRRDVPELVENAADDLIGLALPTQDFQLIHDPVQRQFNAGHRIAGVTVTLAVQLMMTPLEFLAIELREQGHAGQGFHSLAGVSE